MFMMLILLVAGFWAYKKGLLQPYIEKLKTMIGTPAAGGAGGGAAGTGSATGDCKGGPYKSTGKVVEADIDKEYGERHYASGKADTTTIEANAEGIGFENYQFVVYITLTSQDDDDNVSLKLGGTHMGDGGWLDHGVSFSGKTCLGREPDHPNTNACVVEGTNIGSLMNKKVGVAASYFRSSGKTEIWTDTGGGWKLGATGTGVDGHPKISGNHEAQLRIDAAKVTIHCATVQEISGGGTAVTPAATTPPAAKEEEESSYARAYSTLHRPLKKPMWPEYPLVPRVALSDYKDEFDECATRRVFQAQSGISYEDNWNIQHARAGRVVKDCGGKIPKDYVWY